MARWLVVMVVTAILNIPIPARAAAGTDCLCRSGAGRSFVMTTVRHSRWACDVKLGYAKGEPPGARSRPATETCNGEEIVQFKVWRCLEAGCTYPYARSSAQRNRGLERIEHVTGPRRP